jgi:two-component system, response regulator PdtaR
MKARAVIRMTADPPEDGSDLEATRADAPDPASERPKFPPERYKKVLIVEDEWLSGTDFEDSLRQAGFVPTGVAISFEEAIACCERETPNFVLMDVRLAGPKDGVQAAIEIRRRWGIRAVFVSAHQQSAYPGAIAADPLGWIWKPIAGDALVQRLRLLLPP